MRNQLFIYLITFVSACTICQGQLPLEQLDDNAYHKGDFYSKIRGKLIHYSKEDFPDLKVKFTVATPSHLKQTTQSTFPADDGSFELQLERDFPNREIWVSVGDFYFGKVLSNEDLEISLDMSLLSKNKVRFMGEGVSFSGADAEVAHFINNYELFKADKKQAIHDEKLAVIMDAYMSKEDKVKHIKKGYDKLASIEQKYSKKNGKHLEWILTNDRKAAMYADILSIHWGKQMNKSYYNECIGFTPTLTSNASIQYYEFLSFYLGIPNRLETKLIMKETLHTSLEPSMSSADLDVFLREFNKKTDYLPYDEEKYEAGADFYMKRYAGEILSAKMDQLLRKIKKLPSAKADFVMLMSQPESDIERELFINKAQDLQFSEWSVDMALERILKDREIISNISSALKSSQISGNLDEEATEREGEFVSNATDFVTLLGQLRNHFPGKSIIIDLWEPWFDKSKTDLRDNLKLKKALDTLPVEMIFLCDSKNISHKSWQEKLSNFPIKGTHVLLNPNLVEEIVESLHPTSLPAYFFIDSEGNFDPYLIEDMHSFDPSKLESKVSESAGI